MYGSRPIFAISILSIIWSIGRLEYLGEFGGKDESGGHGVGINGKLFWQFINTHCGGQLANAYVKVLPTTNITNNQFTAIGNKGGKGKVASNLGGVRKAVQNWCIFGISPQHAKQYGGFTITKTRKIFRDVIVKICFHI